MIKASDLIHVATLYVAKQRADYDAEVRDWYENGDGRPSSEGGRGWSFPHCIHGSSLWTDYDNICGGCEDPRDDDAIALDLATDAAHAVNERQVWLSYRPDGMPSEQVGALVDWMLAPITAITPKG